MELKSGHASPVMTDPAPSSVNNKSRLGIHYHQQQGASFSPPKSILIPRKKPATLDDVSSNGWLDAMKSSSPPRKRFMKDFSSSLDHHLPQDDSDTAEFSWMVLIASFSFLLSLSTKYLDAPLRHSFHLGFLSVVFIKSQFLN